MLNKKRVALSLLFVLIIGISFFSLIFAQEADVEREGPTKSAVTNCETVDSDSDYLIRVYCVWLGGYSSNEFSLSGEFIKWIFLILIVVLIYSSFSLLDFPKDFIPKAVLSVLFGLLSTFLITTNELLTSLQGYRAGGIALGVFFPIFVLMFFTYMVITRADGFGRLGQKILWMIFSVYLFFKSLVYWILQESKCVDNYALAFSKTQGIKETLAGFIGWFSPRVGDGLSKIVEIPGCSGFKKFIFKYLVAPFYSQETLVKIDAGVKSANFDTTILLLMILTSIAVFIFMVWKNEDIADWLQRQNMLADLKARERDMVASDAYIKENANALSGRQNK